MKISMYATMSEVRSFTNGGEYSFHDVNLAQIYALYQLAGWTRAMIADHLGYAVSTVSTKRHYMWDYADLARILFCDEEPEIEWGCAGSTTKEKDQALQEYNAGLMTVKQYLRAVYRDLSEEEIEERAIEIMEEQKKREEKGFNESNYFGDNNGFGNFTT